MMWRVPALFAIEAATLVEVYRSPHWYCAVGTVGVMVIVVLLMARGL